MDKGWGWGGLGVGVWSTRVGMWWTGVGVWWTGVGVWLTGVGGVWVLSVLPSLQSNPAKWDSGFLSVAAVEGTNDNPDQATLEEVESGGGAGEVFAVEIGDSPMVQGRQRRMSMSCPSSPVLERRESPAIPEGEGPECPHEGNALTVPLVGFVASSALDLFSSQECRTVSVLVGSRPPYRVSWPSSLAWSRDAEESGWSIRDFRQLWRTEDTDSMEGMGKTLLLKVISTARSAPHAPTPQSQTRTRSPLHPPQPAATPLSRPALWSKPWVAPLLTRECSGNVRCPCSRALCSTVTAERVSVVLFVLSCVYGLTWEVSVLVGLCQLCQDQRVRSAVVCGCIMVRCTVKVLVVLFHNG